MLLFPVFLIAGTDGTNSKMSVAVVDFQVQDIEDTNIGLMTANLLIDSLNKTGVYSMKERLSLDKLISEQKLVLTGLINEQTAAEIGKFYGVQGIVIGNVMKFGTKYIITARLVEVNTASILYTGQINVNSFNEIVDKMDDLSVKLCPAIPVKLPDYSRSVPFEGLLIPGMPQYQADDKDWGLFYLICGIVGAGVFAGSEIIWSSAYNNYIMAATTEGADNYYNQMATYNTIAYTGAGLWAASAIISCLHAAFGHTGSAVFQSFQPVNVVFDQKGGFMITISGRF
jgi:TolB-like protein